MPALSIFTYLGLANGADLNPIVAMFGAAATGVVLLAAADLGLWRTTNYATCRCWKCGWGLAGERRHVMDEFTRHLDLHK